MTQIADISFAWLNVTLTRLGADTSLSAMVIGTYVHPPEALSPPYILLSPPRLQTRHGRGIMVVQGEALFTLWSPAAAIEAAHTIMARLQHVLTSSPLSLSPHHLVSMRVLELHIQRTQQRDLIASILRVNLWIEGV